MTVDWEREIDVTLKRLWRLRFERLAEMFRQDQAAIAKLRPIMRKKRTKRGRK